MKTAFFLLLLLPVSTLAQTCATSSKTLPLGTAGDDPKAIPNAFVLVDDTEHKTGQHSAVTGVVPPGSATAPTSIYTSCIYTHVAGQPNCNVQCPVFNKNSDTINPRAGLT